MSKSGKCKLQIKGPIWFELDNYVALAIIPCWAPGVGQHRWPLHGCAREAARAHATGSVRKTWSARHGHAGFIRGISLHRIGNRQI